MHGARSSGLGLGGGLGGRAALLARAMVRDAEAGLDLTEGQRGDGVLDGGCGERGWGPAAGVALGSAAGNGGAVGPEGGGIGWGGRAGAVMGSALAAAEEQMLLGRLGEGGRNQRQSQQEENRDGEKATHAG